ncbi:hypothetical protein POX_a01698 [Penicillium oxalicum]|uniref:hypothetical protein n=1 Tax=Penicillium oxalicum TaxID=69781 RepID=UPI0020B73A98|nr:hypothetical protein POX_a01698 [Penicillium oxalicum]KAI2795094.1 hypothetical protein POX_a01698 [Penicillium oxalicum]
MSVKTVLDKRIDLENAPVALGAMIHRSGRGQSGDQRGKRPGTRLKTRGVAESKGFLLKTSVVVEKKKQWTRQTDLRLGGSWQAVQSQEWRE